MVAAAAATAAAVAVVVVVVARARGMAVAVVGVRTGAMRAIVSSAAAACGCRPAIQMTTLGSDVTKAS